MGEVVADQWPDHSAHQSVRSPISIFLTIYTATGVGGSEREGEEEVKMLEGSWRERKGKTKPDYTGERDRQREGEEVASDPGRDEPGARRGSRDSGARLDFGCKLKCISLGKKPGGESELRSGAGTTRFPRVPGPSGDVWDWSNAPFRYRSCFCQCVRCPLVFTDPALGNRRWLSTLSAPLRILSTSIKSPLVIFAPERKVPALLALPISSQAPGVVPFEEVWNRSYCRTIEMLVDVAREYPSESEYIFKPSCVPLLRCAGCCGDEKLHCTAQEMYNVTIQVIKLKPLQQVTKQEEMIFTEHSSCECRPRRKRLKGDRRSGKRKGPRKRSKQEEVAELNQCPTMRRKQPQAA
ncbi:uncharacterized protein [Narcine bancroftii]|uniref:uncharacterized protein n=1 Tax=Narcine bancroftii TaxID=1343680 RepID=UPI003831B5B2